MSRVSIFEDTGDKDPSNRVQAVITRIGRQGFEQARKDLRTLHRSIIGQAPAVVSDADTIEFLVRGPKRSRVYLEKKRDR